MKPSILCLAALLIPGVSVAQNVQFSGLAYLDYEYIVDGVDDLVGDNGFGYRRVYLTSDFALSEDLDARVRLEARDDRTNDAGYPTPFVKDAWVRWRNIFASGHRVTIGVSPTPVMIISERHWAFRSLDKMIIDRQGIAETRDFGVSVRGPILSNDRLRYSVMVANNSGVRPETDRAKRVYGQIELHSNRVIATLGGDYAAASGSVGNATTGNAFVGLNGDLANLGVEGFVRSVQQTDANSTRDAGLSIFARAHVATSIEAVVRVDHGWMEQSPGARLHNSYVIIGLAFTPDPHVRIIPNLLVSHFEDSDKTVTGRLTMHVAFR